jgi:hypothetical protein
MSISRAGESRLSGRMYVLMMLADEEVNMVVPSADLACVMC